MYCPKCKNEFREGFTYCPNCDVDLVDQLEEESLKNNQKKDNEKIEAMKPVKLINTETDVDADIVINLLKENDIQSLKKAYGFVGKVGISNASSFKGVDIFVDEADYQKAKELIEIFQLEENNEEDEQETLEEDNTFSIFSFFRKYQLLIALILTLLMCSPLFIALFQKLMNK